MKQLSLLAVAMLMCAGTASASGLLTSVEDRADALNAKLKGNNSYQAHLAREFAGIALEEKAQHDVQVAGAFMSKAEEYAGGMK